MTVPGKGGRPLKFNSPQELEDKALKYFNNCRKNERPLTMTGLAIALDTTRETIRDYSNKELYSDTIKKLREIVHNYIEEYSLTTRNPAGAIFNLKNNFGWKDKQEVQHSGTNITLNIDSNDKGLR